MASHKESAELHAFSEQRAPHGCALHCWVRDPSARIKPRRHGNWKHGNRANGGRAEMRAVLQNFRALMRGTTMPHSPETPAPGWLLYPYVRLEEAEGG